MKFSFQFRVRVTKEERLLIAQYWGTLPKPADRELVEEFYFQFGAQEGRDIIDRERDWAFDMADDPTAVTVDTAKLKARTDTAADTDVAGS